ncbi:MAG: hydroxyacid dehydrogenase [Candidatus Nealsonbacteria bacterium]
MKILVAESISKEGKDLLEKAGFKLIEKLDLSKSDLKIALDGMDGLIIRSKTKMDREVIESAKTLKVIGRAGIGLDNIDVEVAKENNIEVLNTPESPIISVAELTFGLILSCARNIKKANFSLLEGKWEKHLLKGTEMYQKTLGIIGMGRIGKEVTKRAMAFGMKIVFFDPFVEEFEGGKKVDLDELYSLSDIITVHVPLSPKTENLISKKAFSKMKDNTIIINASRGGIIDEDALYDALHNGKILSAGLDVFKEEPAIGNRLIGLPNVVATPHLGSQTIEGQERVSVEIAEKMIDFLK